MTSPTYPSLYQINTRIYLRELGRKLGKPVTLDDVPDADLDAWAALGFDCVWLLGIWQTGPAGRDTSRTNPEWRKGFLKSLPDLKEDDITGSPFAVQAYTPNTDFGGKEAVQRIRE